VSEATAEAGLFAKIAHVMGEVSRIPKDGFNDFHKYSYVTEAALVEAVRAKLAEKNVALIPSLTSTEERPYETEKGKHSVVTTAHVAFTFVDGDTGAMFKSEWAGQGDDPADKGLYKAYTGALKYFLMKTFLIPTGDDPEADTGTDQRSQGRTGVIPRGNTRSGGAPSDKQIALIQDLVKKKKPTLPQLQQIMAAIGAEADCSQTGWTQKLTAGKEGTASALITYLKEKPLPSVEHPTDVPNDFDPGPSEPATDVPWEAADAA
jgi:hypothetical protein